MLDIIRRNVNSALQEVLGEETGSRSRARKRDIMFKAMEKMSRNVRVLEAKLASGAAEGAEWGWTTEEDAQREIAALEDEIARKDELVKIVEADMRRWTAKDAAEPGLATAASSRKRRRALPGGGGAAEP